MKYGFDFYKAKVKYGFDFYKAKGPLTYINKSVTNVSTPVTGQLCHSFGADQR